MAPSPLLNPEATPEQGAEPGSSGGNTGANSEDKKKPTYYFEFAKRKWETEETFRLPDGTFWPQVCCMHADHAKESHCRTLCDNAGIMESNHNMQRSNIAVALRVWIVAGR